MTIEEFLANIKANSKPDEWTLDVRIRGQVTCIRSMRHGFSDTMQCPICWEASRQGKNPYGSWESYSTVSEGIGLSYTDAADIAQAADYATHSNRLTDRQKEIRAQLLDACGLTNLTENDK